MSEVSRAWDEGRQACIKALEGSRDLYTAYADRCARLGTEPERVALLGGHALTVDGEIIRLRQLPNPYA